jgi:uncharacterized protein YcfL
MKKTLLFFTVIVSLVACMTNDKKATTSDSKPLSKEEIAKVMDDTTHYTTIEWIDSTTKNLGQIKKDQPIEISYRFKNSGKEVLVIENVSAQCGCTIPEQPTKPYAPGEEGVIKAKFNGSGGPTISKQIYVKANTNPSKDHTLTFTGEITEPK